MGKHVDDDNQASTVVGAVASQTCVHSTDCLCSCNVLFTGPHIRMTPWHHRGDKSIAFVRSAKDSAQRQRVLTNKIKLPSVCVCVCVCVSAPICTCHRSTKNLGRLEPLVWTPLMAVHRTLTLMLETPADDCQPVRYSAWAEGTWSGPSARVLWRRCITGVHYASWRADVKSYMFTTWRRVEEWRYSTTYS